MGIPGNENCAILLSLPLMFVCNKTNCNKDNGNDVGIVIYDTMNASSQPPR